MTFSDGVYRGRACEWTLGETKKGEPQMVVVFALLDEGFVGQQSPPWRGYFTDKSFPITMKALRAMGWTGTDINTLSGLDANEVELVIANETYEGKTYTKVQFVNAPGSGPNAKPLAPDKAVAFAAKLKGQILAFDKKNGGPPAAKPAPAPIPTGDVPF